MIKMENGIFSCLFTYFAGNYEYLFIFDSFGQARQFIETCGTQIPLCCFVVCARQPKTAF
jgi:hypothetical protein